MRGFWIRWAGPSENVVHDGGGEFQLEFKRLCERLNIERPHVSAADSPWQMGLGERHGGRIKAMVRNSAHEISAVGEDAMEMVLLEWDHCEESVDSETWSQSDSACARTGHTLAGQHHRL